MSGTTPYFSRPRLPLVLGFALPVLALLGVQLAACGRTPQGDAANGGRWFVLNRCSGCHGPGGRGARGPAIAGTPLSFHRFLGKLRTPNSEIMPSFAPEQLTDQDAADIYLWLHTQQR